MEQAKTVRSYIQWYTPAKKILTLVLLLLGLGAAVLAVMNGTKKSETPTLFDPERSGRGDYVYVDAVGVSDWVYKVGRSTVYYLVQDSNDYFCVAEIPDGEYKKLSALVRYFNDGGDVPEPVRLTGLSRGVVPAVRDAFMEALELSGEEFDEYFGDKVLHVGQTQGKTIATVLGILAVLCLGAFLALVLSGLILSAQNKKTLARLEQRGQLARAEAELQMALSQTEEKQKLCFTENFLFGRRVGLAAPWPEVLWCYKHETTYNFAVTQRNMVICTADGKAHSFFYRPKYEDEIRAKVEAMALRNPKLLIGYTTENRKAYKELCKRQ